MLGCWDWENASLQGMQYLLKYYGIPSYLNEVNVSTSSSVEKVQSSWLQNFGPSISFSVLIILTEDENCYRRGSKLISIMEETSQLEHSGCPGCLPKKVAAAFLCTNYMKILIALSFLNNISSHSG